MNYERFTDRKDSLELIKKAGDFRVRKHGIPSKWVIYLFVGVILAIIVLIIQLSIRLILIPEHVETIPVLEIVGFLGSTVFLVTVAAIFSSSLIYRIRDTITEIEFINMAFASSMRLNSEFCLICNSDKNVIYYDHNFNSLFPRENPDTANFDRLADNKGIAQQDLQKITDAVTNNRYAKVPFSGGNKKNLSVVVEPLPKPAGYSIIRCYSEK